MTLILAVAFVILGRHLHLHSDIYTKNRSKRVVHILLLLRAKWWNAWAPLALHVLLGARLIVRSSKHLCNHIALSYNTGFHYTTELLQINARYIAPIRQSTVAPNGMSFVLVVFPYAIFLGIVYEPYPVFTVGTNILSLLLLRCSTKRKNRVIYKFLEQDRFRILQHCERPFLFYTW